MAKTDLGKVNNFSKIGKLNNDWTRAMNYNLIRLGIGMTNGVKSKTTPLPAPLIPDDYPAEGTMYIDPSDKSLCMWLNAWDDGTGDPKPAGWFSCAPNYGVFAFVEDENSLYVYSQELNDWDLLKDYDAPHQYVRRELSFYAPGLVRSSAVMFSYVASMEFTLEAGAPNSGAALEVAPSGDSIQFLIQKGGATVGTITFADGSTNGSVSVSAETVINPAAAEGMYVKANMLTIVSPGNVRGATGLQVTLRGKVRAID